ncbi:MAG: tetratricopeptide repeat protein [Acidobacteriota bacterium]
MDKQTLFKIETMKNKGKKNRRKNQIVIPENPAPAPSILERQPRIVILGMILFITAVVYSNSLRNGFVQWDDDVHVFNNSDVKHLDIQSIHNFFKAGYLKMYQPVTMISYALDYKIGKLNPFIYHCTNLVFHLLNVALVFYLILLLTRKVEIAAIAAVFFGIHPLHVESVAWISERKDLLYSFFYLSSLIAYIFYCNKSRRLRYYVLAILCFLLSLCSKSAAVTLPVVLLLVDYYLGKRLTVKNSLDKVPFFFLSILFGMVSLLSQRIIGTGLDYVTGYTILDRLLIGSYSFAFYIIKSVVPFGLSALHPLPFKSRGLLPIQYYFSILFFIGLAGLIIRAYKSKLNETVKKDVMFGLLFFTFTIALILFIPVGQAVVAERYTYIPYIGLFMIAGRLYVFFQQRSFPSFPKLKYCYATAIGVAMVFFACSAYGRNAVWKDTLSLFSDVIKKNPEAGLAYNNRGNVRKEQNDFKGAMEDYNKAIELKYDDAYDNRGILRNRTGDYKNAIEDFDRALTIRSDKEQVYYNRGNAKLNLGDFKGAEEDFGKAIEINPQYLNAYNNRGYVRYEKLSVYKGAIEDFDIAARLDPTAPDIYINRGNAKLRSGDLAGALPDYDKALLIMPDYPQAYLNKGIVFLKLGDPGNACLNWNRAAMLGSRPAAALMKPYCR